MTLLRPREMARICRKLARELRREHQMGTLPAIHLTGSTGGIDNTISRAEAADSLDEQADRWEAEARTGELNVIDRKRIGFV